MVEVGGVEPPSPGISQRVSTCLVDDLIVIPWTRIDMLPQDQSRLNTVTAPGTGTGTIPSNDVSVT